MKWVNKRSGASRAAGAISAVLLATILAAGTGSGALASAYGETHDKRKAMDPAADARVSQSTISAQGPAASAPFPARSGTTPTWR